MDELKKPKSFCYGITNLCKDGSRVFFADYDKIEFSRLIQELNNLIESFPKVFTNFIILESHESYLQDGKTVGSYHIISPIKLPYQKLVKILEKTSVDPLFSKMLVATTWKSNNLRISPKFDISTGNAIKEAPRFICFYPTVKKLDPKGKISTGHLWAYKYIFDIPSQFTWHAKEDHSKWIEINKYETGGI